jgi:hypothetical protein
MYTSPVSQPVQICGPVPVNSYAAQSSALSTSARHDNDTFIAIKRSPVAPRVMGINSETKAKPARASVAERTMSIVHEAVDKITTFGTQIYRTTALQLGRLVAMIQSLLGRAEPVIKEKVGELNEHASLHVQRAKNYVGSKAEDLSPKIHAGLDEAGEWLRSAGSATPAISMTDELPFTQPAVSVQERHEKIAKRAEEKYRETGSMGGRDELNWLAAEAEYEADAVS